MKKTASTLEQKVEWLLTHRMYLVGKTNVQKVALAMKHDGLLGKSTYWTDASNGIRAAIKNAKYHIKRHS